MENLNSVPQAERASVLAAALRRATATVAALHAELARATQTAEPVDVASITTNTVAREWLPAMHVNRQRMALEGPEKAAAALARARRNLAAAPGPDWFRAALVHASAARAVRDAGILEQLHESANEHREAIGQIVAEIAARRETAATVARGQLPDLQRRHDAATARAQNLERMISDLEQEQTEQHEQLVASLAGVEA
jgi:hypothetical protein